MPTLPNVEDLGTRPIPQSNREIAVVRNAGAVGQAVSELGATASHVVTQLEAMHDEDQARRLDIAHADAARKIRLEAEQAQGMNAAAARSTADQQMQALNANILSQARSHAVRDALTPLIARRTGVEMDSVAEHALRQTTAAMGAAVTARRDMAISEAEDHWDNPNAVEAGLNTAVTEIANSASWRGAPPEQIAAEQMAARSQIRTAVAQRMAGNGDYVGALSYVDAHRGEIDHQSEVALRAAIRAPMLEDAGEAIVDRLSAVSGATVAPVAPPTVQPVQPGNIDVSHRPAVHNPDGTVSTVRTISIGTDTGEVLIPTVVNGRVVSNAQAIAHYRQTGENLGTFHNAGEATTYAQWLHEQEARRVAAPPAAVTGPVASSRMVAITAMSESSDRERDARGNLITSPAGAQGRMQVMPATAANPGYGIRPSNGTDEDRSRVGRDLLGALMQRYHDPAKAWAAYNWDSSGHRVDALVARYGDNWLAHAPAETRAYVQQNVALLNGTSRTPGATPSDVPTGVRIDYTAARAEIDAMDLPRDVRRSAINALERRVSLEDGVRTRMGQDAETAITQRLVEIQAAGGRLTSITQIDPALIRQATQYRPQVVAELQRQVDENNRPHDPPANSPEMMQLITLAAVDPNRFLSVNPELLRGRVTSGEVEQLTRLRNDIATRTGPQPSQIMGVIQRLLPSTGMIPAVPINGRPLDRRIAVETARQTRENLTGRLLSAVSERLHRDHGQAPVTEEDILRAVQAEVTQVNVNGQPMRVFEAQERGAGSFSVQIPRQTVPYVDEVLRRSGLPLTENNRATIYLQHREELDNAANQQNARRVGFGSGPVR